jgi:hypothetical protein
MTGYSFAHVLKFKEYDQGPPNKKGKGGKPGAQEEEKKEDKPAKEARLNLEHPYAKKYLNKVMLSSFTQQYYILDPSRQDEDCEKDYSMTIWV